MLNPEVITFECLREAVQKGVVLLPDDGPSACTMPTDPSRETTDIKDLPSVECSTCRFGRGNDHKVYSSERLQFIGSNPTYYATQLASRCKNTSG